MRTVRGAYLALKRARNTARGIARQWIGRQPCPLCGSPGQRFESAVTAHYYMGCPTCDLVYVGRIPPEERLLDDYRADAFVKARQAFHERDGEPWKDWIDFKKRTFDELGLGIESGRGRRLLEIGCGEGYLLDVFAQAGWSVTGIELNTRLAAAVRARGHKVVTEPLETLEACGESFDRILMFHVVEHLADPMTALRKVAGMGKPDGDLVIETPVSRNFESTDHLYFFNRQNLANMLARCGLKVGQQFQYRDATHPEFENLAVRCRFGRQEG